MTDGTDGRLRLTILGGFLGSGKTTWLRHQLFAGSFGQAHVIVNEAADAPVDDVLLAAADEMTLLSGACACCDGQDDLRQALLALCDARSRVAEPFARIENIVLETSGLAEPAAIAAMIQGHPVLVRQILVAEVIVIVDAQNAIAQIGSEALSRKQIEAADRLVLTKTDIAEASNTLKLRATLHAMAPGAEQTGASFGSDLDLPALPADTPRAVLKDVPDEAANPIRAHRLNLGETPDWTAFTVWLSALLYARGDQVVRVKGVVRTPAGRLLLQSVRQSVQSPEILPDPDTPCDSDNSIAVIGRGFTEDQLTASLARFTA
ncbi:MAG: GTP-binding protein [Pelagibaca sp.]